MPGVRNLERDWRVLDCCELERCNVELFAVFCVVRLLFSSRPVVLHVLCVVLLLLFWAERLRRLFALAEASGPSGRPERLTDDAMVDECTPLSSVR